MEYHRNYSMINKGRDKNIEYCPHVEKIWFLFSKSQCIMSNDRNVRVFMLTSLVFFLSYHHLNS